MHSATSTPPLAETISTDAARRYYDFWGSRYDWLGFVESRAKSRLLELLELSPGMRLLNVGLGAGQDHKEIAARLGNAEQAFGVDLSLGMLRSAKQRTGSPLCQANGSQLPFAGSSFDRLYAAYVLDLISTDAIPAWLQTFQRILRPGGRLALSCLTEGVTATSRSFVSLWKLAYAVSPLACGGCRPLRLEGPLEQAGFRILHCEVIIQLGIPSQILCATH